MTRRAPTEGDLALARAVRGELASAAGDVLLVYLARAVALGRRVGRAERDAGERGFDRRPALDVLDDGSAPYVMSEGARSRGGSIRLVNPRDAYALAVEVSADNEDAACTPPVPHG